MKAELEEAVKELGFTHTVIVMPGLLVGERKDNRPPEAVFRYVALGMRKLGRGGVDGLVGAGCGYYR